jgi:hypothetical protein
MWWLPLAMMGAGAAKGALDQRQAGRQRKAEAEIARWSPWTGMQAQRVDDGPGILGGAMQGGVSGLGLMQGMSSGSSSRPIGNISDTTPGYSPSVNPASTQAGQSMIAAAPQQNSLNLFQPGTAPAGYEWMEMGVSKNPYTLFGSPTQQMLAQK